MEYQSDQQQNAIESVLQEAVSAVREELLKSMNILLEFSKYSSDSSGQGRIVNEGAREVKKSIDKAGKIMENTVQHIISTLHDQRPIYLTANEYEIRINTLQHKFFKERLEKAGNKAEIESLIKKVRPLPKGISLLDKEPDKNGNFQVILRSPNNARGHEYGMLGQDGKRIVPLSANKKIIPREGESNLLYEIQDISRKQKLIVDKNGRQLFDIYFTKVTQGRQKNTLNVCQDTYDTPQRGVVHIDTVSRILPLGKYKDGIPGKEQFQHNGNYRLQKSGSVQRVIVNPQGEEIIQGSEYQQAPNVIFKDFNGANLIVDDYGNYPLYKKGNRGLLNKEGKEIIPFKYKTFDMAGEHFEEYEFT
jgi:hypothetical protein